MNDRINMRNTGKRKDFCKHGHALTEENVYWRNKNGRPTRQCQQCRIDGNRRGRTPSNMRKELVEVKAEIERLRAANNKLCEFLEIALDDYDSRVGLRNAEFYPNAWDVQARKFIDA